MKSIFPVAFILLAASLPALASQEDSCSTMNTCHIEKKTWVKKGWSLDYAKDLQISSLCVHDRPTLQLEPKLGLELWVFGGDKSSSNWLDSQPHITANLYTDKLTYVVATGSAPLNSGGFAFSHRLNGKTFVEVNCFKK